MKSTTASSTPTGARCCADLLGGRRTIRRISTRPSRRPRARGTRRSDRDTGRRRREHEHAHRGNRRCPERAYRWTPAAVRDPKSLHVDRAPLRGRDDRTPRWGMGLDFARGPSRTAVEASEPQGRALPPAGRSAAEEARSALTGPRPGGYAGWRPAESAFLFRLSLGARGNGNENHRRTCSPRHRFARSRILGRIEP
jgi:hypothetical protein